MNSELPICKLCRQHPADKENSHIIPKFLAKSLYDLTMPRHTLAIQKKTGKWEKRQDTPREDHLLCTACEKRLEIIETYFSKRIREMHAFTKHPDKFTVNGGLLVWEQLSPALFRLFIYSIIWRGSVSSLYDFQTFKLGQDVEENLRVVLDKYLKDSQLQLLNNLPDAADLPPYHICMMKPLVKTSPPGGLYSVYSYNENMHLLMVVDFVVFFITDDNVIDSLMKPFSNQYYEKAVTGLMPNEHWEWFNRFLYGQVMDNLNKKTA